MVGPGYAAVQEDTDCEQDPPGYEGRWMGMMVQEQRMDLRVSYLQRVPIAASLSHLAPASSNCLLLHVYARHLDYCCPKPQLTSDPGPSSHTIRVFALVKRHLAMRRSSSSAPRLSHDKIGY